MDKKIIARFWSRVDVRLPEECWPWEATRNRKGYGVFWDGSRTIQAHRFSAVLHGIEIPSGFQCAHSCHNPACCNPIHLRAASGRENVSESVLAGRRRHLVGENHNRAKLTESQVREIIRLNKSGIGALRISRMFHVCKATVSHILTGRNWKSLNRDLVI
jgi:hypothetical protein